MTTEEKQPTFKMGDIVRFKRFAGRQISDDIGVVDKLGNSELVPVYIGNELLYVKAQLIEHVPPPKPRIKTKVWLVVTGNGAVHSYHGERERAVQTALRADKRYTFGSANWAVVPVDIDVEQGSGREPEAV